tara:strand:- start:89 stop:1249 length:1161 start_codon:yes stop_codon:yes gene_type:complete
MPVDTELKMRDRRQFAYHAPSSEIVSRWTNADVILWALDANLKSHIPALVQHELTGGALQQLSDQEEVRKALCVQATEVTDEFVLKAFELRLKELNPDTQVADIKWDDGRLTKHPSGWTYERECKEWADYLDAERKNTIAAHLGEIIHNMQSWYQLTVLILSSIVSVMTSTKIAGADFTDNNYWNVAQLVLSLLVTLCSGYTQLNLSKWKVMQEQCKNHRVVCERLIDRFSDELCDRVEDRTPYPKYNKDVSALWKDLRDRGRMDAPSTLRNRAIARIELTDPSQWKRAFAVSEEKTKCTKWTNFFLSLIGCAPNLSGRIEFVWEPKLHTAMLMRFSGENMGEHTSEPAVFSEDKAKACSVALRLSQVETSQGKASRVAPTQEAGT